MSNWNEYYYLEPGGADDDWGWILRLKANNEVIGKYRDIAYARKQAKYKYKKLNKKLEKILLG